MYYEEFPQIRERFDVLCVIRVVRTTIAIADAVAVVVGVSWMYFLKIFFVATAVARLRETLAETDVQVA